MISIHASKGKKYPAYLYSVLLGGELDILKLPRDPIALIEDLRVRKILRLRFQKGKSYKEIGKLVKNKDTDSLGVSHGRIGVIVHKGLRSLKKMLFESL